MFSLVVHRFPRWLSLAAQMYVVDINSKKEVFFKKYIYSYIQGSTFQYLL